MGTRTRARDGARIEFRVGRYCQCQCQYSKVGNYASPVPNWIPASAWSRSNRRDTAADYRQYNTVQYNTELRSKSSMDARVPDTSLLPSIQSIQAQARVREMMDFLCRFADCAGRHEERRGGGTFQGPDEEMTQSFEAIQWTIPRDDNDQKKS